MPKILSNNTNYKKMLSNTTKKRLHVTLFFFNFFWQPLYNTWFRHHTYPEFRILQVILKCGFWLTYMYKKVGFNTTFKIGLNVKIYLKKTSYELQQKKRVKKHWIKKTINKWDHNIFKQSFPVCTQHKRWDSINIQCRPLPRGWS